MTGPLEHSQINSFHADGFLVCPDLLAENAFGSISQMVEEIAGWPESDNRCQHYRELTQDGPVLARTERFLSHHDGMRNLLTEGILSGAVAQLFDEPAVVFKEKINYKQPGGGGFAPHQDAKAYPYGSTHITCLVAVDENTIDNGCLWFVPGRHKEGLLETDDTGCLTPAFAESLLWTAAPLPPGGVTFFTSFSPHKSLGNSTSSPRRSLYVTYNRGSEGDLRTKYYDERDRRMAGHDGDDGDPPRISTIGHFQGQGVE